jgi:uncharacterized Zn finger protein (UPF0148 family)
MKLIYFLLLLSNSLQAASWFKLPTQECPATDKQGKITCTLSKWKKTLTFIEEKENKEKEKTTCTYIPANQYTQIISNKKPETYCKESALVTLFDPESHNLNLKQIETSNQNSEDLSYTLPTLEHVAYLASAVRKNHPNHPLTLTFLKQYYSSNQTVQLSNDQETPPAYQETDPLLTHNA